jgi:hypothetical protein
MIPTAVVNSTNNDLKLKKLQQLIRLLFLESTGTMDGNSGAGCVSVGGVTSRVGKASASTGNHDGAGLCRRELGSV